MKANPVHIKGSHMMTVKAEDGFSLVIHSRFGEISNDGRWAKELRIVEWGIHPPKFDIRAWDVDESRGGSRSQKGITLTLEEISHLKEILEGIDLERFVMPDKLIRPKQDIQ